MKSNLLAHERNHTGVTPYSPSSPTLSDSIGGVGTEPSTLGLPSLSGKGGSSVLDKHCHEVSLASLLDDAYEKVLITMNEMDHITSPRPGEDADKISRPGSSRERRKLITHKHYYSWTGLPTDGRLTSYLLSNAIVEGISILIAQSSHLIYYQMPFAQSLTSSGSFGYHKPGWLKEEMDIKKEDIGI